MTDRKVMRLALEALESAADNECNFHDYKHAAEAIRQALEQPSDIEAAVLAEREACAEIAYSMAYSEDEPEEIAKAIRARMK